MTWWDQSHPKLGFWPLWVSYTTWLFWQQLPLFNSCMASLNLLHLYFHSKVLLDLSSNALMGTIPSEIGLLTWLSKYCHLVPLLTVVTRNSCVLHFNFHSSAQLDLYDNNLTGEFTCPDYVPWCYVSCSDDPDNTNATCRSLWETIAKEPRPHLHYSELCTTHISLYRYRSLYRTLVSKNSLIHYSYETFSYGERVNWSQVRFHNKCLLERWLFKIFFLMGHSRCTRSVSCSCLQERSRLGSSLHFASRIRMTFSITACTNSCHSTWRRCIVRFLQAPYYC